MRLSYYCGEKQATSQLIVLTLAPSVFKVCDGRALERCSAAPTASEAVAVTATFHWKINASEFFVTSGIFTRMSCPFGYREAGPGEWHQHHSLIKSRQGRGLMVARGQGSLAGANWSGLLESKTSLWRLWSCSLCVSSLHHFSIRRGIRSREAHRSMSLPSS